jgi:pyruvate dehydrogenase E1 component beta subunit
VTPISWGAILKGLAAADELAVDGIQRERSTSPPSNHMTRHLASVAKTGRCVIVHEAARTGASGRTPPSSPSAV